jgi:hypothetical protein
MKVATSNTAATASTGALWPVVRAIPSQAVVACISASVRCAPSDVGAWSCLLVLLAALWAAWCPDGAIRLVTFAAAAAPAVAGRDGDAPRFCAPSVQDDAGDLEDPDGLGDHEDLGTRSI